MTLRISSPADEPFGCLHPDAPYKGFREDGVYWSTLTQYLLAQTLADPKDRETVRMHARDAEDARARAATMPRVPDAEARMRSALTHAVRRRVEANLEVRGRLLATGCEEIVLAIDDPWLGAGVGADGRGENALGRALEEIRAIVRVRAEDEAAIQCEHQGAETTGEACVHLLESFVRPRPLHRWFRGGAPGDARYALICPACRDGLPAAPPLRTLCGDCFDAHAYGDLRADVGRPAFATRASGLRFERREIRLDALPCDALLAIAPIARMPHAWIALRRDGRFVRLDVARGAAEEGGRIELARLDAGDPPEIELTVAPGGDLVAIAAGKGRAAQVIEPASGRVLRAWERDDYHPEHCRHPLGLFELDGRLLLLHATEWNRLDVMDPRTGERLTERESPTCRPRAAHYLDYFHAALRISPDGERVIDDGWIWHPWGQVRAFSLRRFVRENAFESEDGESVRELAGREWFWDGPIAWLDETRVAIWGEGDEDTKLVPAAQIWDVERGERLRTFHGPAKGFFAVCGLLVAGDAERIEAWDPETGERLAEAEGGAILAVHPRSGELIGRGEAGALRVWEVV
jgi:predicted NAD-dependent protein-ADP-ribosyltransferase YbiA (DUF1768 family)